jgi:hypothetical protein
MNQQKAIITIMIIFATLVLVWAADGVRVRTPHPDTPDGSIAPAMTGQIPFDFQVSSSPGPHCDPVDVDLIIETGESRTRLNQTWRLLDGASVQLECDNFYDLYYRSDGPGCFNIRIVSVEEASGRMLSLKRGHMCLK